MRGNKTAVYRSKLGQELVFDNRGLYLEDIDMTGLSGVHTVETLVGLDGQTTVNRQLGARTIPCSFAVLDADPYRRDELAQVFNPLVLGTLTVYTQTECYSIDCYPQNVPVFKPDSEIPDILRWEVDFVADDPFWRVGPVHERRFTAATGPTLVVDSPCPLELPLTVYFPANPNRGTVFSVDADTSFALLAHSVPLIVDTRDFSVINADTGEDANQYLNIGAPLERVRIRYGTNRLMVISGGQEGIVVRWQELSLGEV